MSSLSSLGSALGSADGLLSSTSSQASSNGSLSSTVSDFTTGSSVIDTVLSPLLDLIGEVGFALRIADALSFLTHLF